MIIPIPVDATYDYIPIDGSRVQVGTDLLSLWTVQGEVTNVFTPPEPGGMWLYLMVTVNPDNTLDVGMGLFPDLLASLPDAWWTRMAVWVRADKPADGFTLTAGDGSQWIYPAGVDGRMLCYDPGSTFGRGDRRFRGELLTDPKDLWICDDADYDWLPITDGDQVEVGDTITFLMANTADVDQIDTTSNEVFVRHFFTDTDDDVELGWWDEILREELTISYTNIWTFFERIPKPAADTMFSAPDGSRWIYVDGFCYCWKAGSIYPSGSAFQRGQITGGLTPLS